MPTECVFKRYFESIRKIFFSSHNDFVLSIKYVFKNLFSKNVPCYENEWKQVTGISLEIIVNIKMNYTVKLG